MIRVLYVDDELALHTATRTYLARTGEFIVDAVPSVQEAYENLEKSQYDVVVSDYQMPGTDGITFLQELRRNGSTIPFILFTGKGREDVVIDALNSGADFYLQKGGNIRAQYAELMHKIRAAVQRRQAEEAILRANETLSRQTRTLSILNRIITTSSEAGNCHALVEEVLTETLSLLDYDAGGIYLTDFEKGTASVVASKNLPPAFLEQVKTVYINTPPFDSLLVRGIPLITDHYDEVSPRHSSSTGFCSLVSVPLLSNNRVIGALNVASRRRCVIAEEEKRTLVSIGRELGSTIGRMAANEAVRKGAQNLTTLFNSIDEMVFVLGMDGKIIRVNETVIRRLGYTPDELLNKEVLFLHVPERQEEALRIVRDMIAGTADSCTVPLRAKDGTRIDVETTVSRGIWDNHEVLIGISRDVTKKRQSEEALKESDETLRSFVRESADGIMLVDESGTVIAWNNTFSQITGIAPEDAVGRSYADIMISLLVPEHRTPDRIERIKTKTAEASRTGKAEYFPRINEIEFMRGDGERRVIQQIAFPLRTAKGFRIGCIARDMTEYRRATNALAAAGRKLSLLAGITRHDIKNQLMALMTYIQLSRETVESPDQIDGYLSRIEQVAGIIEKQISFTLDYEDMGAHASSWQNVGALVRSAAVRLPVRNTRICCECNDLEIFADPLLGKVFHNLLDNSLRHGGCSLTTVRVTTRQENGSLVCIFEDDGAGIPAGDKPSIFNKGFGQNSGFGLFLVREILSISGITIHEQGSPGKGARFEMTVPKGAYRFSPC
ncbi:MAG: PAS domain S-box protein [Methanoregula sp.]